MSWTVNGISLDGSNGLGLGRVELGTGMVDYAEITSVDDWSSSPLTHGDWVDVKQGATTVLFGQVMNPQPYAAAGGTQGVRYNIVNPWHHIMQVVYKQQFTYATSYAGRQTKWRSKVWLGVDHTTGLRQATNLTVADILDYCIAQSGLPFSYSISGWGTNVPVTEATDQTAGSLIMQILRWHPNVMPYWRYTLDNATLILRPVSSLSGTTISVSDPSVPRAVATAQVKPRHDLIPPCVVVKYERINEFTSGSGAVSKLVEFNEDVSGAIGDQHAPGAVVFTIELAGIRATGVEQPIRTRTVPQPIAPTDTVTGDTMRKTVKWVQCHVAALKIADYSDLVVTQFDVTWDQNVAEEPTDGPTAPPVAPDPGAVPLTDFPNELLEGQIQEWMGGIKATPMIARVHLRWAGAYPSDPDVAARMTEIFGDDFANEVQYYARYMGTNAQTTRYSSIGSWAAAEPWPTGLAAAIAQGMTDLRYEGTVTIRDQSAVLTHLPGMYATLSGATGSGVIQRVSIDAQSATTTIVFGYPEHLNPQDLYELMRASRNNPINASYDKARLTSASPSAGANTVQGALRAPRADVQPGAVIRADHPLKVTVIQDGSSKYVTVAFGTFCGRVPMIGTGFIGSTDPTPQLAITGSGTEYVAIKSTWTMTFTNDFLTSADLPSDGVEIIVDTSDPTVLTAAEGEDHVVLLATLIDGVKTGQAYLQSIAGGLRDHGDPDTPSADIVVS